MTILQVVQDVCEVVGVARPTSVFALQSSSRTMQEMIALANEMAQRIAYDTREFREMKTSVTFVGDGVKNPTTGAVTGSTAFNLPANYLRMLLTSNVWRSTSALQPMTYIPDTDIWYQRRAMGWIGPWGEWTLLGNQMLFDQIMMGPIPGNPSATPPIADVPAVTATFAYLDKNCVVLKSGGMGDRFVDDLDAFRLPERVLKLGMIWQWKAQKGAPYAEDMGTYSDALQVLLGSNKPMPILIDRKPISAATRVGVTWPPGWGLPST